jgi:hypothetical protein
MGRIIDRHNIPLDRTGAMATTYTSTIEFSVWKEHTCSGCGSAFRYLFKRKKSGQGGTPDAAKKAAQAAVVNSLAHEVDMQPCPGCGLYQPDMVGAGRARGHGWLILVAVVILAVTLILYATDVLTAPATALVTAGLCGLVLLAHWMIDNNNPNRNLEANRRLAQQRLQSGELWTSPDRPTGIERNEAVAGSGWTAQHTAVYALLLLGVVAFLTPELFRLLGGWRTHREWVPTVVGPGDQPYLYFKDKVTSVKGLWAGRPVVKVVNYKELGLANDMLQASSNNDNWGMTISVDSKSKESTITPWVRIQVPDSKSLEDKKLELDINMDVQYPQLKGSTSWDPAQRQMTRQHKTLLLASSRAGSRYRSWWWSGFLGGACLTLVGGFMLLQLCRGMRQRALPTQIYVPGEPRSEQPAAPRPSEAVRPDLDDPEHRGGGLPRLPEGPGDIP